MSNGLGEFVVKFLKEKTETRKIIKCDDFFQLIHDMGLNDDNDEVIDILEQLENNNTDINFHGAKTGDFYRRFQNIEKKVQLSKMLKGTKTEVQQLIEKVDKIKVQDRPDWLDYYRDEDGDDKKLTPSDRDNNLAQSIIDKLTQKVKEQVENEPGITLNEIREEINNEINNN